MLASSPAIAFVPSTDLDRSRRFYAEVLGLLVEENAPYVCVLRGGGVRIMVTRVDQLVPQPFTILGFEVSDVRQKVAELTARGVEPRRFDGMDQDADAIWSAPGGGLVVWFADPDGNTLSLTQFA